MDAAWQTHNPADGNVDIDVLVRLGATVEATRVAVTHVLLISGDAIAIRVEWKPTATVNPNLACYTALSDFQYRVMSSAHKDSTHAKSSPIPGGAGKKAGYTSGSGPSRHITREVTSPGRKTTKQREIPTRPELTYVTKTVAASMIKQDKTKITPSNRQAVRPPVLPPVKVSNTTTAVKQKTAECLQNKVVIKRSRHVHIGMPKGAWRTNVVRKQPIVHEETIGVEKQSRLAWPLSSLTRKKALMEENEQFWPRHQDK